MGWYVVIKTIKGHRYRYRQRTWREGAHVRTESIYLGPEKWTRKRARGSRQREASAVVNTTWDGAFQNLGRFVGTAWRADTGLLIRGKSALDVIEFEEQELGNIADFAHLSAGVRAELAKIGSEQVVWVARRRSVAARYGDAERVDVGEGPRILAEDGDDGFLVLRGG